QLVGVNAGDRRDVRVTFPAEYGNRDLAGKEGVFEVAVTAVRHRLPAAIDDELAKAVGLETLAELRQEVRQRMQRDYDGITRQRLKQGLLDKLAERYDFPVPPGMIEMEFNSIWAQYEADKERQKEASAENADAEGDGTIDAAAAVAPEETALEGASDQAPPRTETGSSGQPETRSHQVLPPEGTAQSPIDGGAVVAPEETALEGASD